MTAVSGEFRRLATSPPADLDALMHRGQAPEPDRLAGAEYRGANTARWLARVGNREFVKGFEQQPDGKVRGYNRRVSQDGQWASPGAPFAYFAVRPVDPAARDNHYLNALLLDYRAGSDRGFDPARLIRDYLVCVQPESDDLLLGRAFLALGRFRPSPSYFVLERLPLA